MSNQINLPNLKDAIKGGMEGLANGAANIISKLKADPTKVAEAEAELEKLRIQAATESERIALQAEEIALKKQESEDKAVTERWVSDMGSDSWMSKNIRPLALASALLFVFLIIITDSTKLQFEVKPEYIELLKTILEIIILAYFGGRSIEKGVSIYKKK